MSITEFSSVYNISERALMAIHKKYGDITTIDTVRKDGNGSLIKEYFVLNFRRNRVKKVKND